jgi:hypothetical protein
MHNTEKIYHIYAKNKCLFHSIKEEDFDTIWNTIRGMISLIQTDYSLQDLSYEELHLNREALLNSSH